VVDTQPVPAISVVMATRNRAGRLARVFECLEAQAIDEPFELVIVDDASTDDTWAQLQRHGASASFPVRPLRRATSGGPGGARNTGWREARAPLIAFTDDDCEPQPRWLATMLDALQRADLVQGPTLPNPSQLDRHGPFGRTLSVTEEGLYPTCNMGYRRSVLEAVGGFDERYRMSAEDTDLAWRARESGALAQWAPEALVYHDVHPSSYRALLRDKVRWDGIPLVVHDHPALRSHLDRGLFWRKSHVPALVAAAGIAIAAGGLVAARTPSTRAVAVAAGVALWQPYVRFRMKVSPLRCSPRKRVALLPATLVADLLEVAVMARGSLRHRVLVL
jgi:glycosyltransferase involved in cell wall biosynthesis